MSERDMTENIAQLRFNEVYNFIRYGTLTLSLLPMGYGTLTLIFGDNLWGSTRLYDAAMVVPFAPESWGIYALVCGAFIAAGVLSNCQKMIKRACWAQSFWCLIFAFLFLLDCVRHETPFGAPGALIHFVFGVIFAGRGRLASKWR